MTQQKMLNSIKANVESENVIRHMLATKAVTPSLASSP